MRQRGRGGGCVGIIPSVVKKKAVAKARLWPCTQMPSFLAVPSLRRQKASMTTTKYFPWRDRVGSHMKMGITFRYLCTTTHANSYWVCSEDYVCIFRAYFFLQNIWDNKLWAEMNLTTIGGGHFTTVSSHFFANYISSFHKIEDLTVILKCPTYLNLY